MTPELLWIASSSSNVARYAYDAANARLYIEFRSGTLGYYSRVPPSVYEEFQRAPSQGSFVSQRLRDNPSFPWTPLTRGISQPRQRIARSSDETRYRHRCRYCGAIRTLEGQTRRLPKHPRKGSRGRNRPNCPGSGEEGVNIGIAIARTSRARR
jgi:hypothetical protein